MESIKIRLLPTKEQESKMIETARVTNYIYNWALEKQKNHISKGNHIVIPDWELRKELTKMKKTPNYNWLYNVCTNAPRQAIKDATNNFDKFLKKYTFEPRIKPFDENHISFYQDMGTASIRDNTIRISKVGRIKLKKKLPKNKKLQNLKVIYDGKYWFISVAYENKIIKVKKSNKKVTIKIDNKGRVINQNGDVLEVIPKNNTLTTLYKQLSLYNEKLNTIIGKNGNDITNNVKKLKTKIALIKRRIRNIKSNHIHQLTSDIINTHPRTIIVMSLSNINLQRSESISKNGGSGYLEEFMRQLEYKSKNKDISFIKKIIQPIDE